MVGDEAQQPFSHTFTLLSLQLCTEEQGFSLNQIHDVSMRLTKEGLSRLGIKPLINVTCMIRSSLTAETSIHFSDTRAWMPP